MGQGVDDDGGGGDGSSILVDKAMALKTVAEIQALIENLQLKLI